MQLHPGRACLYITLLSASRLLSSHHVSEFLFDLTEYVQTPKAQQQPMNILCLHFTSTSCGRDGP